MFRNIQADNSARFEMHSRIDIPEGDPRHLDIIDDILGRLNLLSTLEALMPLAVFTDPVFGMPIDSTLSAQNSVAAMWREHLHLWHVAYFAKVVMCRSNPYRKDNLTSQTLALLINHFNAYDVPLRGQKDEADRAKLAMAYQQFPYQNRWWRGMTRAKFMYDEGATEAASILKCLVARRFGMSYGMLLETCASIYHFVHDQVRTGRRASFTLDELGGRFLPRLDRDQLECVLDTISQTPAEFRQATAEFAGGNPEFRKFDFNPLFGRPVVCTNRRYYIPVPALVLMWATDGVAYTLSDYARAEHCDGKFWDAFGHAFEDFIEDLLIKSGRPYKREFVIKKGRQQVRSADFILTEGSSALIFDCKTRRVTPKHRYGIADAIDRDYGDIVSGLEQDMRTEAWMRAGIPEISAHPELLNASTFSYSVVTLDDYYLANSPTMQQRVQRKLKLDLPYQVISARELELLLVNLPDIDLIPFIEEKSSVMHDLPSPYEDYLRSFLKSNNAKFRDPSGLLERDLLVRLRDRLSTSAPHSS